MRAARLLMGERWSSLQPEPDMEILPEPSSSSASSSCSPAAAADLLPSLTFLPHQEGQGSPSPALAAAAARALVPAPTSASVSEYSRRGAAASKPVSAMNLCCSCHCKRCCVLLLSHEPPGRCQAQRQRGKGGKQAATAAAAVLHVACAPRVYCLIASIACTEQPLALILSAPLQGCLQTRLAEYRGGGLETRDVTQER